jgi:hypothetical protein
MGECYVCKFWNAWDLQEARTEKRIGIIYGECRRLPPTCLPLEYFHKWDQEGRPLRVIFPVTTDTTWCGEFQPNTQLSSIGVAEKVAWKVCANGHGNKIDNDECWICESTSWIKS